jgi:hypothetical protein
MHSAIDVSHAIPAVRSDCLAVGCHDASALRPFAGKSVGELHADVTTTTPDGVRTSCQICHADGLTPTTDCLTVGCHADRANPHSYDALTHTSNPAATPSVVSGATYPALACSNCHSTELGVEHTKPTSAGNTGCSECHATLVSQLPPPWDNTTCAQGGCHTPSSAAPQHAGISAAHARLASNDACFASGCHAEGNLASIHAEASGRVDGQVRTSCMLCHADGVPASRDCTTCHADKTVSHYDASTHTATVTTGTITILGTDYQNESCAGCHSLELGAQHIPPGECADCHATLVPAPGSWNNSCVQGGCHTVGSGHQMHAAVNMDHSVGAQTCTETGCHSGAGSLAVIHSSASTTTADVTLSSCQICHAAGRTPSARCADCHDIDNPHGDNTATHAAAPASETITISQTSYGLHACSECHAPANLLPLHGNDCARCHPTPKDSVAGTWGKGCVQAGCHTVSSGHQMHAAINADHALGAESCTTGDCHTDATDLASIHANKRGCATCHSSGRTSTGVCTASGCHPDLANVHPNQATKHTSSGGSGFVSAAMENDDHGVGEGVIANCSDCHISDLIALHANNCATCHASSAPVEVKNAIADQVTECTACHPNHHNGLPENRDHEDVYSAGECSSCHDANPRTDPYQVSCTECHAP